MINYFFLMIPAFQLLSNQRRCLITVRKWSFEDTTGVTDLEFLFRSRDRLCVSLIEVGETVEPFIWSQFWSPYPTLSTLESNEFIWLNFGPVHREYTRNLCWPVSRSVMLSCSLFSILFGEFFRLAWSFFSADLSFTKCPDPGKSSSMGPCLRS